MTKNAYLKYIENFFRSINTFKIQFTPEQKLHKKIYK